MQSHKSIVRELSHVTRVLVGNTAVEGRGVLAHDPVQGTVRKDSLPSECLTDVQDPQREDYGWSIWLKAQ